MSEHELFEQALDAQNRTGELRRLAQRFLDDGTAPETVLLQFEQVRQRLRETHREEEEDAVMEVMDFLAGWCSPHVRLVASQARPI